MIHELHTWIRSELELYDNYRPVQLGVGGLHYKDLSANFAQTVELPL